jgi:aminopeptidase N
MDQTGEIFLKDYRKPGFAVDTVDLHFTLHETATRVRARLSLRRQEPGAPLSLDGEALELTSITLNGAVPAYTLTERGLAIEAAPDVSVLETEVVINPAANTLLTGLYLSGGNYFTQCEAEGFRRITFFPDRPDVMARYTTTIVADRPMVLLSNGNPAGEGRNPDGTYWARWADPHPKPSYLFALVAGDLVAVRDHFTTASGKDVALAIWVRAEDRDKCGHAMAALKQSMRWDEETFGLEYDLEVFNIAAVSDFNMGAMENKGLNVFNTKYVLAKPDTATDGDYEGIDTVISHEYFHNWTGNRVTCRDWFQLSLKEGLTVFRDQEFTADQGSRAVKRIRDVERLRAGQFPEDAGPLAHPVRPDRYRKIDNFYTATVYQKGAEVIRMIRTLIGQDAFRRGMDLYIARHDNTAATIEDFVAAMQAASGQDLRHFMRWYDQAGTPVLRVEEDFDPAARRYTLTLEQSTAPTPNQPDKFPLTIPVAMGLLAPNGQEVAARLLTLTEARQSFVFDDIAAKPVPSLLRGFSAPVRLEGLAPAQLRFLAAHDSDPFVAWESGQQAMAGILLRAVRDGGLPDSAALIAIISANLAHPDPAFAALAITLPGEAFLADQMKVVDPEGIARVREAARQAIGGGLQSQFRGLYDRLEDKGPYLPDGPGIGRRSLRNAALGYMAAGDADLGASLAFAQFESAANMTDSIAALAVLTRLDRPERLAALERFYQRWWQEPLVLDKWFALQAVSSLPGTPAAVRALLAHPDFDWRNPNRLRAVVASFAVNQRFFHAADGDGYAFLADAILRIDPLNGQVAARAVAPLGQWRRHTEARQTLMRAALARILAAENLSENTREMAARALG